MAQPTLTQGDCRRMWEDLKTTRDQLDPAEFIRRIDHIDAETPWSEVEPRWWLEMQAARRAVGAEMQGAGA